MKVEYSMTLPDGGTGKVTREMTQESLATLLTRPDVVLLAVNRDPPVYYHRKKKGR